MRRSRRVFAVVVVLSLLLILTPIPVASKVGPDALASCAELAFSTEEDFITQGPEPIDGNPIWRKPVFAWKIPGMWFAVSAVIERISVSSSATVASSGNRSEIINPLAPRGLNS